MGDGKQAGGPSAQWIHAHRKTSKLPRDKVFAAHKLHEAGLSIREIGRLLAKPYGYASSDAAAQALMRAFRFYRLPARDRIEATVAANLAHGRARRKGQPGSDLAAYARWRRSAAVPVTLGDTDDRVRVRTVE